MLPLWAKVDLGAMAIKGYSAFPKAPASLEPLCRVGVFCNSSQLNHKTLEKGIKLLILLAMVRLALVLNNPKRLICHWTYNPNLFFLTFFNFKSLFFHFLKNLFLFIFLSCVIIQACISSLDQNNKNDGTSVKSSLNNTTLADIFRYLDKVPLLDHYWSKQVLIQFCCYVHFGKVWNLLILPAMG